MREYDQDVLLLVYLSAAYPLPGLFQFGGIATVELSWLPYTLGAEHAVLVSMGAYVLALEALVTSTASGCVSHRPSSRPAL